MSNPAPSAPTAAFGTAAGHAAARGQELLAELGLGHAPQLNKARLFDLLSQGASVQEKNTHGQTALMVAIHYGHTDIAEKIIAAGASIHARDHQDNTPLLWCGYTGNADIALRLLRDGARIDDCNSGGRSVLTQAAHKGYDDFLKTVIGWGLDADHIDKRGDTALCAAAAAGRKSTARVLIDAGANPLKPGRHGQTPAQIARAARYSTVADAIEYTIEDCRDRILHDEIRLITEGLREEVVVSKPVKIRAMRRIKR